MNTRKCKKCGWEYPATWSGKVCRFCHEPMEMVICASCGELVDKVNPNNYRCTKCCTRDHSEWSSVIVSKAEADFNNWLTAIKDIQQPYKTLTEEQWLDVCKHFDGCAYCGSSEIASRSMFIPFKLGGRYCAWNIIPACERCETALKLIDNPFNRMNELLHRGKVYAAIRPDQDRDRLRKITEYLRKKM